MNNATATSNQLHSASALTEDQIRKLTRLQNRATAYEIICTKNGSVTRIAYTQRHSQNGLIAILRDRLDSLLAFGVAVDVEFVPSGKGIRRSLTFADGSVIRFSGRTQRGAIIEGEYPFLPSVSNSSITEAAS